MESIFSTQELFEVSPRDIPPSMMFRLHCGTFSGSWLRSMLEKLAQPYSPIDENFISYFTHKFQRRLKLWICRSSHINQLGGFRRRVLVVLGGSADWSIIEFNTLTSGIIHYIYLDSTESLGFRPKNDRYSNCEDITIVIN